MILAQAYQRFAFDLDGVLWRGDEAIAGAPQTITGLRDAGKALAFVTNNSANTPEVVAKRLAQIGAGGDAEEVVTSGDATARLLQREIPAIRGRLVYVLGGAGLREAVAGVGARLAPDEEATDASVVVVGMDRSLTYERLRLATLAIRAGATFVASNDDATFPAHDGFWPGAGAIVAALRTSTGVEPLLAGKPQPTVFEIARERLGGDALAVGDRIETDIAAAHAAGWPSALVLTGASTVADLACSPIWPEYIIGDVADLLEDRPHPTVRMAAGADLPLIAQMLHHGGLRSGAARERMSRTVVAEIDRTPIGTAAWEPVEGVALLRSVAVGERARGVGVGRLVVAAALRAAREAGIGEVYLGTEDAAGFFSGCGFQEVARDELPEAIAEHPQLVRDCSAAAVTMRLRFPQP